ncbi:MAG TPA: hypothetical protein VF553_18435 [Pyrinomonadaceae bacterium]
MSAASCRLWRSRRVSLLLAGLYSSLLAVLYLFISTREASVGQVLLTLLLAALAPALFFMLQAVAVNYAQGESQWFLLLRRSPGDSCKLALVSLPLILLALVFIYLLNKLQLNSHILTRTVTPSWPLVSGGWLTASGQTRQWSLIMISTLRLLVFAILLPLLAIHLWSATVVNGLLPTLKRAHRTLALALRPSSVLIYALGLTLFAVIPYFLLFGHVHAGKAWIEIGLLLARLLMVFLFTIYGWTLTVSALIQGMKDEG